MLFFAAFVVTAVGADETTPGTISGELVRDPSVSAAGAAGIYREERSLDLPGGWRVSAWVHQGDEDLPAKLCFHRPPYAWPDCVFAVLPGGRPAQYVDSLAVVKLAQTPRGLTEGLLFVATLSYGGSGLLRVATIWSLPGTSEAKILLKDVCVTEIGEMRIVPRTPRGVPGVFVAASGIWLADETHFAEHRFRLTVYRQNQSGRYIDVGSYTTSRKYQSESPYVIGPEMGRIDALLASPRRSR